MRQARIKPSDSLLVALRRAIAIKTATEAGASQQTVEAIALKAADPIPSTARRSGDIHRTIVLSLERR